MIELRILGSFDLRTSDGRTLDEALRRSKRVALLSYLAAARPVGFHRRDKVAAMFWPDLDKERARGALRTTLSRLRDDLGDDVVESRGAEEISVRRERLWCDVSALYLCLEQHDAVGAADLYRGAVLDGVHVAGTSDEFEQWISEERANIRVGLLGALSTEVDRLVEAGDSDAALGLAQRAVLVAPDDESAARRLIVVALAAGDRGAALRAFEDIARVLRREYNVAPSAETSSLVAALRGAAVPNDSGAAPTGRTEAGVGAPREVADATSVGGRGGASAWLRRVVIAAAVVLGVSGTWHFARVGMSPSVPAEPSGAWRRLNSGSGTPHARHHTRLTADSSGAGALLIGGASIADGRLSMEPLATEVWRLIGFEVGAVSQWSRVPIRSGTAPSPRWMFGAAYDRSADRWFVHGGALGWSAPCANDTWMLDNASGLSEQPAWRPVHVRGKRPPPRAGFELSLDRGRRKLILFGGNDCVNLYYHDTWALNFDDSTFSSGTWTRVSTDSAAGQPVMRTGYASIYDTVSARLFVFGGVSPLRHATAELWVLDHADGESGPARWHAVRCSGETHELSGSANAYDTGLDRWSFFAGADQDITPRRDLWHLDGLVRDARACKWTRVRDAEPWPLARISASAVILPGNGGFLLFGGQVEQFSVSDSWVLGGAPHP